MWSEYFRSVAQVKDSLNDFSRIHLNSNLPKIQMQSNNHQTKMIDQSCPLSLKLPPNKNLKFRQYRPNLTTVFNPSNSPRKVLPGFIHSNK